ITWVHFSGELVNLNGRALPFFFSTKTLNEMKKHEESVDELLKEMESLRVNSRADKETIVALRNELSSLIESHSNVKSRLESTEKENVENLKEMEKKMEELKKEEETLRASNSDLRSRFLAILAEKQKVESNLK
ncbi:hypothetical protein PFISCL1PPCAC_25548, partial [Pristionchus fissidentatus]